MVESIGASFDLRPSSDSKVHLGNVFLYGPLNTSRIGCLQQIVALKDLPSLDSAVTNISNLAGGSEQPILDFLRTRRVKLSNWPSFVVEETLLLQLFSSSLAAPIFDAVNNSLASSTAQDDSMIASLSALLLNTLNTMRSIGQVRRTTCYKTFVLTQFPEMQYAYSNLMSVFPFGAVISIIGFTSMLLRPPEVDDSVESLTFKLLNVEGVNGLSGDEWNDIMIIAPPAQFQVAEFALANKRLTISLIQVEHNPKLVCCTLSALTNEEIVERAKHCDCNPQNECEVFRLFKLVADRGSPEAQYLVGMCFKRGKGVRKAPEAAFNHFLASAEQGYLDAMYEISDCYRAGFGTQYSAGSCRLWLERCAVMGHAKSQLRLGYDYEYAYGSEFSDLTAAYYWFAEAGKQVGDGDSEIDDDVALRLGACFEKGHGVGKNIKESLKWFSRVRRGSGAREFQLKLAGMHHELNQLQEAASLYLLAAEQGSAFAQFRLAKLLEHGAYRYGISKDIPEAIKWYTKAAENGNHEALCRMGQFQKSGLHGMTKDVVRAVEYFRAAADFVPQAQYEYGLCVLMGEGRPKSVALGESLLQNAADKGIVEAQLLLGQLMQARSAAWFEKAGLNGSAEAIFQLGCLYKFSCGERVRNESISEALLEIAAMKGHAQAQNMLK